MPEHPMLQTARLVLRPYALTDAPDLQRLIGDREVASTTTNIPHPYEEGMAEAWINAQPDLFEQGQGVNFAITTPADDALIGGMGLRLTPAHQHGELGYWIGVPFWNHGYCTEAAQAVVTYGFETLALHRILAYHMTRNPASGRVMEKIGMRYEGCLRQHICKWGVFEDAAVYGILKSEFDDSRVHRS
jgi:RimJ/RimL family protein N-acetyltransferase